MDDFKDVLEEPNYKKYYKYIIVGILLFLLIIILIFLIVFKDNHKKVKKVVTEETNIVEKEREEPKEEIQKFKVDIKGEVNFPTVYELEEGSRVIDVINMAGGLTINADTSLINLSKKISDEMIIIIYSKEEIALQKEKAIKYEYTKEDCICPDNINEACIESKTETSNKEESNNKTNNTVEEETQKIININTATLEELQTLSGVGESKAKSIIEYREENGTFNTIEDIKNVSGIGDAMYEKIKDSITV